MGTNERWGNKVGQEKHTFLSKDNSCVTALRKGPFCVEIEKKIVACVKGPGVTSLLRSRWALGTTWGGRSYTLRADYTAVWEI